MAIRHNAIPGNTDPFFHWPELIQLAREPNVWIKVSYFPESTMKFEKYPFSAAQRYFRELYEAVGAKKLIWGSNYPRDAEGMHLW